MNRILTKCWPSITLTLSCVSGKQNNINCMLYKTILHIVLYFQQYKMQLFLFICAIQLCTEQNNHDLVKKYCLTNSLCFCLCWNLANAFLFSHCKDIAVVKDTLLSSQQVQGAQVWVLDTGQSLFPSRMIFTRQRVTMQTAPATSCCPLEPHAWSTTLSQHLPTCIYQRTKYEHH